jgi:ABC-type sugar transport system permease subunit
MPWRGRPFIGLDNYAEILTTGRFWTALAHMAGFTVVSVSLELALGMVVALGLDRSFRGRGLVRAATLIPWALPTVVAALLWRFLFEDRAGIVNALLMDAGAIHQPVTWLAGRWTAWVPIVLAEVWKTTPFVALVLLAGLQSIDPTLYQAAQVDGATSWQRFRYLTLPLLRPAILVALIFRTLDALRVFDLIYALTGGGPGTSTEPVALYTFTALLQYLRFGYGAALGVIGFVLMTLLALLYLRFLGVRFTEPED